jgi:uncharacterized protein
MLKKTLLKAILTQRALPKQSMLREIILPRSNHVVIISGVRRCGKSTLMYQQMKKERCPYYINFEDPLLIGFGINDFQLLEECFHEKFGKGGVFFFDEIQNVPEWERYVRGLVDRKKRCFVTGSNASLLSRELGTKLTGRHITMELFPFSWTEFYKYTKKEFGSYLSLGGFPEYIKENNPALLSDLFRDILLRDIVVRHSIRDARTLQEIAVFLLSNIGKLFSFNTLAKHFRLGSMNTVASYLSYLEDSYLFFSLSCFDYSLKVQAIRPKKIYAIDTGMITINSKSLSPDLGRLLENAVFLYLRRKASDIYYWQGDFECDFIADDLAVQVCYELTEENKEREIEGLKEAMKLRHVKRGLIVTSNQTQIIDGIEVVKAKDWFSTRLK